MKNQEREVTQC